ncbi:MAG TPA: sulfatase-like hydrolase/transferase, partial [Cyclobacteriaceae bacterium]|nr:sulfatase-like hydrolase/transferase [Cyclobacteriaceae bacterium]
MKKLVLFLFSVALFGCAKNVTTKNNIDTTKKPNVVFFLIDDLGWKDLACFGSNFYETPNIDKLAKEGVKFTNAYAA